MGAEDLTQEMKDQIIKKRLRDYNVKIFQMQLDKTALEAIADHTGAAEMEKRITNIQTAYDAIAVMVTPDADSK